MIRHSAQSCPFRRVVGDASSCELVAELAATRDVQLTQVSDVTCQMCASFYAPSAADPNPIVASIADDAAQATGNERLQAWLRRFQRTGLNPDTVSPHGLVIRHANHPPGARSHSSLDPDRPIFMIRRRNQSFAPGVHRSGWPLAYDALAQLHSDTGVALDDFVEQRFGYHMGAPGYQEPWIGIFHHPLDDPGFAGCRNNLDVILQSDYWRQAEPWLQGAICLSQFLANQLSQRLSVPIHMVKHPVRIPDQTWSIERFQANPRKKLIQMGWYQRNTQAIYSVPPVGLRKLRVLPWGEAHEDYDRRVQSQFASAHVRYGCRVIERAYIHPDEYESALTENVMFTHMLTASANNVVVDCIAAHTPLIINRQPAVEEYLGTAYPLYYDDFEQVPELCKEDALLAASDYLRDLDKTWASADHFRTQVHQAVLSIMKT